MKIPPLLGLRTDAIAEPSASERKRLPNKKKPQLDEKAPKAAAPDWWDKFLKDHVLRGSVTISQGSTNQ